MATKLTRKKRQPDADLATIARDLLVALEDVVENVVSDTPEMWTRAANAIAKAKCGGLNRRIT